MSMHMRDKIRWAQSPVDLKTINFVLVEIIAFVMHGADAGAKFHHLAAVAYPNNKSVATLPQPRHVVVVINSDSALLVRGHNFLTMA